MSGQLSLQGVSILPYAEEDFDALMRLERTCFSDAWSEDSMKDCLALPVVRALVAKRGAEVVGFAIAYLIPPEGEIADICVSPNERGQGIGQALLEALLSATDCVQFFLEVRASNSAAIGLYGKLGFEIMGIRKRYYDKPREDAVVMSLFRRSEKGE